jgi:hypothetical protein
MLNLSKITDYLLVYLLIAFSGVPFFYKAHIVMMIGFLIFPLFVFISRKKKIKRFFIVYFLIVLCVQVGQMLKFYQLPMLTFLGLHVRLIFAYLVIEAVGKKTIQYYIDILVFSVVTSLFFYIFSYLGSFNSFLTNTVAPLFTNPLIKDQSYTIWPTVILYTINPQGEGLISLMRNSGPFWEPGAFSGFLMIALLFQIIKTGTLFNRKSSIIMLGIVSTFSTSGIMVLAFVISAYLFLNKNVLSKWILLPFMILISVVLFLSVDFLGAKVVSKMNFTSTTYNTRFKSALLDLEDFSSNPFLGLGRSDTTRFKGETRGRVIHRNNGVTYHLATYGLIIFLLYFSLIYIAFYRMSIHWQTDTRMALFAFITILLIGFSQVYFTKLFFIALTMMPVLFEDRGQSSVP